MTYANPAQRQELIGGLRSLADFLESNPDVPAPEYTDVLVFPPSASDDGKRREIDVIASHIGPAAETFSAEVVIAARERRRHARQTSRGPPLPSDTDAHSLASDPEAGRWPAIMKCN